MIDARYEVSINNMRANPYHSLSADYLDKVRIACEYFLKSTLFQYYYPAT